MNVNLFEYMDDKLQERWVYHSFLFGYLVHK